MTIAPKPVYLHGSVNVIRTLDGVSIGDIKFREDTVTGIRRHGLFGPTEKRSFSLLEDAIAWVEASRNIPDPVTSFLGSGYKDGGPSIYRLLDLPDGKYIGVCKFARTAPAIYPIPERATRSTRILHIVRTNSSWSVYDRKAFTGRRSTLEKAILRLIDAATPSDASGHEILAWKEAALNFKNRMAQDGLPFDSDLISTNNPVV